jgi:hypothetical protein
MEGWRGSGATRALDRDACQSAVATLLPRSFLRKRAVEFGGRDAEFLVRGWQQQARDHQLSERVVAHADVHQLIARTEHRKRISDHRFTPVRGNKRARGSVRLPVEPHHSLNRRAVVDGGARFGIARCRIVREHGGKGGDNESKRCCKPGHGFCPLEDQAHDLPCRGDSPCASVALPSEDHGFACGGCRALQLRRIPG